HLEARGFAFAPPALAFTPLHSRAVRSAVLTRGRAPARWPFASAARAAIDPQTVRAADLNGDGRNDVCAVLDDAVVCALALGAHKQGAHAPFAHATPWLASGARSLRPESVALVDVNGDGRADWCGDAEANHGEPSCALSP